MRIDLGDGQYADVKEISELTDADAQACKASYKVEVDETAETAAVPGDYMYRQANALLLRIITGWSFPGSYKNPGSLGRLSLAQGRKLRDGVMGHLKAINQPDNPAEPGTDPTEDSAS